MDYIGKVADAIKELVPESALPDEKATPLFRSYAVLALAKGASVSQADVHNAWAAWIVAFEPNHDALVPFDNLTQQQKDGDRPYLEAIQQVASRMLVNPELDQRLFPSGLPIPKDRYVEFIDLYKVLVGTSEALVSRRQGLNTFFLTLNGVLLTATGLLVTNKAGTAVQTAGLLGITAIGCIFGYAWHSLIQSYGQLNKGKFKVINRLEKELVVAIFDAEWFALGEGNDNSLYKPFTARESWAPKLFAFAFGLAFVIVAIVAAVRWGDSALTWVMDFCE